jgi:hypothetical protein
MATECLDIDPGHVYKRKAVQLLRFPFLEVWTDGKKVCKLFNDISN